MSLNAPVAIFAFNRPNHLKRLVESLLGNEGASKTSVTVFCDGPKSEADLVQIEKIQTYLRSVAGFESLRVISSPQNQGLSKSIIGGITHILSESDVGIFLDDDLLVGPYFLSFMNEALRKYKDHPKLCSIHGFSYLKNAKDIYFLKGGDCCGWATWRSAWSHFEADGKKLLQELIDQKLTREFDLSGTYDYTQMLRDQIAGKKDSWAIRWRAATFIKGLHTLYPPKSLYLNEGFDGSGTNCAADSGYEVQLATEKIFAADREVKEDPEILRQYRKFLMPSFKQRFLRSLSTRFNPEKPMDFVTKSPF